MTIKNKMKKSNQVLAVIIFFALLVIVGSVLTMENIPEIKSMFIITIVVILAFVFLMKTAKNTRDEKEGLTIEDERSRKVSLLAGAISFQISIWFLVVLLFISNVFEIVPLSSESALGAGILGMPIIYGITWLWANKQEDLDKAVKF